MSGHVDPARLVGALTPEEEAHVADCPLCQAEARLAQAFAAALPTHDALPPVAEGPPLRSGPTPGADRYVEVASVGAGGMGEVVRVLDPALGRTAAMKTLALDRCWSPEARARFEREARVTAQLQHPGIVPVYEVGVRADGRPYYTMLEVTGQTLRDAIAGTHASERPALQPLLRVFLRVCEAMAYAHARGVVHRDLKPGNIMLGAYGEVRIVDWGLARVDGDADAPSAGPLEDSLQDTLHGTVAGTAAYMPPEQARGDVSALGPWSDVYALGAILFEILTGSPPYVGATSADVVMKVLQGAEPALPERVDPDLASICRRAMARRPHHRPQEAGALADDVRSWLEGAQQRERATNALAAADRAGREVQRLRARVADLRARAAVLLEDLPPHAPVEDKLEGWALQDRAHELELRADQLADEQVERLRSALADAPDLDEAHQRLADHFAARHAEAEARRDTRAAAHFELQLRTHDRGRYARYLRGHGTIDLETEPAGATVVARRFETEQRRLVQGTGRTLGITPLEGATLPSASWLLTIEHPDREPVVFPLLLGRGEAVRPDRIVLPEAGGLGPDEVLVPAGWFWSGHTDRGCLPRRRLWCGGFVMERHVVTNARYIAFLDALVAEGREDEALQLAPRERGALNRPGALIYGRRPDGTFELVPDAEGDVWQPDWPVLGVTWHGARAFAAWQRERTGLPWRLPFELEWEKAARGVDGRLYPWGDFMDPTWSRNRLGTPGRKTPAPVGEHPVDCSVWGVRGLAGNVRERCLDAFDRRVGPPVSPEGHVVREEPESAPAVHALRGHSWGDDPAHCAVRTGVPPDVPGTLIGFRLVRGLECERAEHEHDGQQDG